MGGGAPGEGGGHSGTEWLPTAKRTRRAEALNTKKRGSKLQTENLIKVVTCNMGLFSLYFVKYNYGFPCTESFEK